MIFPTRSYRRTKLLVMLIYLSLRLDISICHATLQLGRLLLQWKLAAEEEQFEYVNSLTGALRELEHLSLQYYALVCTKPPLPLSELTDHNSAGAAHLSNSTSRLNKALGDQQPPSPSARNSDTAFNIATSSLSTIGYSTGFSQPNYSGSLGSRFGSSAMLDPNNLPRELEHERPLRKFLQRPDRDKYAKQIRGVQDVSDDLYPDVDEKDVLLILGDLTDDRLPIPDLVRLFDAYPQSPPILVVHISIKDAYPASTALKLELKEKMRQLKKAKLQRGSAEVVQHLKAQAALFPAGAGVPLPPTLLPVQNEDLGKIKEKQITNTSNSSMEKTISSMFTASKQSESVNNFGTGTGVKEKSGTSVSALLDGMEEGDEEGLHQEQDDVDVDQRQQEIYERVNTTTALVSSTTSKNTTKDQQNVDPAEHQNHEDHHEKLLQHQQDRGLHHHEDEDQNHDLSIDKSPDHAANANVVVGSSTGQMKQEQQNPNNPAKPRSRTNSGSDRQRSHSRVPSLPGSHSSSPDRQRSSASGDLVLPRLLDSALQIEITEKLLQLGADGVIWRACFNLDFQVRMYLMRVESNMARMSRQLHLNQQASAINMADVEAVELKYYKFLWQYVFKRMFQHFASCNPALDQLETAQGVDSWVFEKIVSEGRLGVTWRCHNTALTGDDAAGAGGKKNKTGTSSTSSSDHSTSTSRRKNTPKVMRCMRVVEKNKIESALELEELYREYRLGLLSSMEKHPNILCCHGMLHSTNHLYFIMDDLGDGRNLMHVLQTYPNKEFPEQQIHAVWVQVLCAISYCHQALVCHRDIKPEIVHMGRNGVVKVTDFTRSTLMKEVEMNGNNFKDRLNKIDNLTEEERKEYCTGSIYDNPARLVPGHWPYMAPEVIIPGLNFVDGALADVWGLGILLVDMILGPGRIGHLVKKFVAKTQAQLDARGEVFESFEKLQNRSSENETKLNAKHLAERNRRILENNEESHSQNSGDGGDASSLSPSKGSGAFSFGSRSPANVQQLLGASKASGVNTESHSSKESPQGADYSNLAKAAKTSPTSGGKERKRLKEGVDRKNSGATPPPEELSGEMKREVSGESAGREDTVKGSSSGRLSWPDNNYLEHFQAITRSSNSGLEEDNNFQPLIRRNLASLVEDSPIMLAALFHEIEQDALDNPLDAIPLSQQTVQQQRKYQYGKTEAGGVLSQEFLHKWFFLCVIR
ncbi:unnamed protein product [Amoebophrya sp. A120]|nr:unnamed protein product [Amoebophrya sp. A120]|eukprot:GSA120T00008470001.1